MKKIILLVLCCIVYVSAYGYDVAIENDDGDTIYYNLSGTEATVTYGENWTGTYSGDIVIPSEVVYDGTTYTVTEIGDCAFYYCSSLTSVTFPESLTSIGDYAFHCCSSLTSVTLPESLAKIGDSAFGYCGLTTVKIPKNAETIGANPFRECSDMISIEVDAQNKNYISVDGILYDKAITFLIAYPIRNGVTEFIIPETVLSIGDYAFYYCSSLTSVTLPESLSSIGANAFEECSSLTSVDLPEGLTSIEDYVFYQCSSLTSVDFPEGLTSIGDFAFYGCQRLTSVDLPESLTSIGGFAFYGCSGLTSVDLPESLTSIEDYAFFMCTNLATINSNIKEPFNIEESVFIGAWGSSETDYNKIYENAILYVPTGTKELYESTKYWSKFSNIVEMEDSGYDITDGLVAYYPFNGNANDESGNENHATTISNVTLTTGVDGKEEGAYQFGGYYNKGYIDVANSESLQFEDEFSFSMYVKMSDWGGQTGWGNYASSALAHTLIGKWSDTDGITLECAGSDDNMRVFIGALNESWANNELVYEKNLEGNYLDKWVHVAMVVNSTGYNIYLNGQLTRSYECTPDLSTMNKKGMRFGYGGNGWYPLNGAMDEIGIYNRALTNDEIKALASIVPEYKEVNIDIDDLEITYGEEMEFTYSSDTILTGDLQFGIKDASGNVVDKQYPDVGTYTIYAEYTSDSDDEVVQLILNGGTLTVTPATLTVTVNDVTIKEGEEFEPSYTVNGLVASDTESSIELTITTATEYTSSSPSGDYTYTLTAECNTENYNIEISGEGKITVTKYISDDDTISDITDGLVAYYPFNGNANDESGNENHATTISNVTLTTGVDGKEDGAYQFGGYYNKGYIDVANSESLQFEDEFSYSMYLKMSDWGGENGWGYYASSDVCHTLIGRWSDRNGVCFEFSGNDEIMRVYLRSMAASWTSNGNMAYEKDLEGNYLDKWVHVALVVNSSGYKVYLNGQLTRFYECTPNLSSMNNNGMRFGYGGNGWYPLNGAMDEIRIYNRALTYDEIKTLASIIPEYKETVIVNIDVDDLEITYGEEMEFTYSSDTILTGDLKFGIKDAKGNVIDKQYPDVGTYTIYAEYTSDKENEDASIFVNGGTLTVTPATLTVTVNDVSVKEGEEFEPSYTVEGLVASDTESSIGLTVTAATEYTSSSPVGDYTYTLTAECNTENYDIEVSGEGKITVIRYISDEERALLASAYEETDGDNWKSGWDFSGALTEKTLPNVTVSDGHVVSIDLSDNNLSGGFPYELIQLPYVESIDLSNNNISGDVSDLAQLASASGSLRTLDISYNGITGNIGTLITSLSGIETLIAHHNCITDLVPTLTAASDITVDLTYQDMSAVAEIDLTAEASDMLSNLPTLFVNGLDDKLDFTMTDASDSPTFKVGITYADGQVGVTPVTGMNVYKGSRDDANPCLSNLGLGLGSTFKTTLDFLDGDATFDGLVDVLDVQAVLTYMFGNWSNSRLFNYTAANLYTDNTLNVQDVIKVINVILDETDEETSANSRRLLMASTPSPNSIYIEDGKVNLQLTENVAAIDVVLTDVKSSQVKMLLPSSEWQYAVRTTGNTTRVIIYSLAGREIQAGTTEILRLTSSLAAITGVTLSDKDARYVNANIADSAPTGIDEVGAGTANASVIANDGKIEVNTDITDGSLRVDVYTLSGIQTASSMWTGELHGTYTVDKELPDGVYIVNVTITDAAGIRSKADKIRITGRTK